MTFRGNREKRAIGRWFHCGSGNADAEGRRSTARGGIPAARPWRVFLCRYLRQYCSVAVLLAGTTADDTPDGTLDRTLSAAAAAALPAQPFQVALSLQHHRHTAASLDPTQQHPGRRRRHPLRAAIVFQHLGPQLRSARHRAEHRDGPAYGCAPGSGARCHPVGRRSSSGALLGDVVLIQPIGTP